MSNGRISTASESAGDLHPATAAMQRAAEAMIAATESFRLRFRHQQDIPDRPLASYDPFRRSVGGSGSGSSRSSGEQSRPSAREHSSWHAPISPFAGASATATLVGSSHSHNPTGLDTQAPALTSQPQPDILSPLPILTASPLESPRYAQQVSITTLPASAPLRQFSPNQPDIPPFQTGEQTQGEVAGLIPKLSLDLTPTTDRLVRPSTAPVPATTFESTTNHNPPSTGRRGPRHVGVIEAAMRLKSGQNKPFLLSPEGRLGSGSSSHFGAISYVRADGHDTGDLSPPVSPLFSQKLMANLPPKHKGPFPLWQECVFVFVICMAQALMLAGIAQALVPARLISLTFPGSTPGDLAWYSAAYGLTAGTFVLPSGRLGDIYGHKKIFTIGFIWFSLWSILAGSARYIQNTGANGTVYFCFCRAMQGIGPALQVPNGQALLGRAYPPGPRKAMVMSLFGASAPFGFVIGAIMASLFAIKMSWEWSFFVLAAVNLSMAGLGVLVLPSADLLKTPHRESLWVRLDMKGILLGVAGLVLFNIAWNQAPIVSWSTPYTYFLLIIGVIFLAWFVSHERGAPHPLLPVMAMTSTTNFILGCTAAGWGCFSVWVYYSFQFLEVLRGWSPLLASASNIHGPVSGLIASLLTGVLLGKLHWRPQWVMLISMCAFFTGSLLMATAPVEQSYWFNTFFSILVMPFGMDMSNPAATILLSNSVSKEHQGIAASLVVTTVNYSISIALGMAGTVETHLNDGGKDLLKGYRGAQYLGLGFGGLGILLAVAFVAVGFMRSPLPSPPKK